ncbi:RNA-binding protein 33-like [Alosa sapidissima]|uniref:RNA-binding protein 33-like n=1 Tax=Alosa sapidissima TaxID=34773 RepID=UPI001C09EE5E|nr:RNA-binding protein 33-like [Alosa sapidissima]
MVVGNPGEDQVRVGVQGGGYCRLLLMVLGAMYLGCLLFSLPYLCLQVVVMLGPSRARGGEGDIHPRLRPLPNPRYPDLPQSQPQPAVIHQPALQPTLMPRPHPTPQGVTPKKRRGQKKKHRHHRRHHHTYKGSKPSTLGISLPTGTTPIQSAPPPTTRLEYSHLPPTSLPKSETSSTTPGHSRISLRLPPGHLLSKARASLWRGRRTQGTPLAAPTSGTTAQEPAKKQEEYFKESGSTAFPAPTGQGTMRPSTGFPDSKKTTKATDGEQTVTPNDALRGDGEELVNDSALDTDNVLYIGGSEDDIYTPEPEASGSNEYIPVLDNAMTQSKNESKNVNSTSTLPKTLSKGRTNGTQAKNRNRRSTGALSTLSCNSVLCLPW